MVAAKLRKLTHLQAKFDNVTRWSSAVQMLERYFKLEEHIEQLEIDDIDELALSAREARQIEKVCNKPQQLDEVTKILQADDTSIAYVRALFDTVIEDFLSYLIVCHVHLGSFATWNLNVGFWKFKIT